MKTSCHLNAEDLCAIESTGNKWTTTLTPTATASSCT
jgi:hypothetical protein